MPLRVIFYEERFKRAQEAEGSNPLKIEGGFHPPPSPVPPYQSPVPLRLRSAPIIHHTPPIAVSCAARLLSLAPSSKTLFSFH